MGKRFIVKKILLLVIISNLSCSLFSQTSVIKGVVCDNSKKIINICNVQILSTIDSSLVKGGTFLDGHYELKDISPGEYLLRISNVQYQTKDTLLHINNGVNDIAPICLKELQLGEVVVYGNIPILKQNNGNYILNIKDSYLKNEPTVNDILRKTPGVLVDNNLNISIFDKDNTSIYINDREIRTKDELKLLQPEKIESVEVIRNPSSQYNANTDAVILIRTIRNTDEMFNISLSNNFYIGRRCSDEINLSIVNKINKISNTFNYNYSKFNNKIYDLSDTYIFRDDTTYMTRRTTNYWNKSSHNLFYSLDYDINEKNVFGIQYMGFIVDDFGERNNIQKIKSKDDERAFVVKDKIDDFLHNVNLNYKYTLGKDKDLQLLADYAISGQKMNTNVENRNVVSDSDLRTYSSYEDKYHIFSTEARFNSIIKDVYYNLGLKYSYLKDNSVYEYQKELQNNELNDQICGFFISAKKQILSLNIGLSMRAEYTSSKINFDGDYSNINNSYWDFFPHINISNKFSNKFTASLAYSRKINRPSFSKLNPRYKYLDSLSYLIGNPTLKPSYTNLVELNLDILKLNVSVSYSVINDYVTSVNMPESNNSDIIKYTYENLDKARFLTASLYYTYNYRRYSSMVSFLIKKPFVKILYLNTSYKVRKPRCQIQYSGNLNLFKNTSITGSFIYRTSGEDATLKFKGFNNLSFGINQYLFNKKLLVSATVMDVFNSYKTNNWENRTGNVLTIMDSDQDSRKFCLTIRYNFGGLKYNSVKKSANTESIGRR